MSSKFELIPFLVPFVISVLFITLCWLDWRNK